MQTESFIALHMVDHGFVLWLDLANDSKIDICYFLLST
jgi:hypothetical protein